MKKRFRVFQRCDSLKLKKGLIFEIKTWKHGPKKRFSILIYLNPNNNINTLSYINI